MQYKKHLITSLSFLAYCLTAAAMAQPDQTKNDYWTIQTSVYTTHFHPSSHHNNHQELIGADYNFAESKYFLGAATFRNSFYQRSFYAYAGKKFELERTPFYARLSGGLIHGYRGKYKNKIPLNNLGTAPAIIPSVGIEYWRVNTELILLGFNAAMVNVGFSY